MSEDNEYELTVGITFTRVPGLEAMRGAVEVVQEQCHAATYDAYQSELERANELEAKLNAERERVAELQFTVDKTISDAKSRTEELSRKLHLEEQAHARLLKVHDGLIDGLKSLMRKFVDNAPNSMTSADLYERLQKLLQACD